MSSARFGTHSRTAAAALAVAFATACSGHGAAPSAVPGIANSSSSARAKATVTLHIPGRAPNSAQRSVKYLNTLAATLTVSVTNATAPASSPQSFNIAVGSPNCSGATCTISVSAPIGPDTFTFTSSDASNAVISTGTASLTVAAGVDNPLSVTLDGVPATVVLASLNGATSVTTGQSTSVFETVKASIPATITVRDVDGSTIVGAFANNITLAASDAHLGLPSTTTLASSTDAAQTLAFSYDGAKTAGSSISATIAGGSATTLFTVTSLGPEQIGTNALTSWYDAADATTIAATASSFNWSDKGTNNLAILQTAAGTIPSYVTSGSAQINGRNVVSFAAGQYLGPTTAAFGFPVNSDYSVFVVSLVSNPNPGGNYGNLLSGSANGHALYYNPTAANAPCVTLQQNGVDQFCATVKSSTSQVQEFEEVFVNATGSASFFINGGAAGSNSTAVPTNSDPTITINGFGIAGIAGTTSVQNVGEILIYNSALSAADRAKVESYLAAKWGT